MDIFKSFILAEDYQSIQFLINLQLSVANFVRVLTVHFAVVFKSIDVFIQHSVINDSVMLRR